MPDVERRTRTIRAEIVRVYCSDVVAGRRIVDRMTPSVGNAELQRANCPSRVSLKGVVGGGSAVVQAGDRADTIEGTEGVGTQPTGNLQIIVGLPNDRHSRLGKSRQSGSSRIADVPGYRLPWLERILRQRYRINLIGIILAAQMSAFAADVRKRQYRTLRKLALNIQVPLLHVRPHCVVGDGKEGERKRYRCARHPVPKIAVAGNVVL